MFHLYSWHSCALVHPSRTLMCLGKNTQGQLGYPGVLNDFGHYSEMPPPGVPLSSQVLGGYGYRTDNKRLRKYETITTFWLRYH